MKRLLLSGFPTRRTMTEKELDDIAQDTEAMGWNDIIVVFRIKEKPQVYIDNDGKLINLCPPCYTYLQ